MKNRLLPVVGTAALVSLIVLLSLTRSFYVTAIDSQFFCLALVSVVLIHLSVRPWSDAIWVAVGTGLLAALDFGWMRFHPSLVSLASLIGMSSIAVFGTAALWAPSGKRETLLYGFIPAILFVISEWFASLLLAITEILHPKTLDLYLFSFDASLRVELSFRLGRWFMYLPWLRIISTAFYLGLPVILALVYACHLHARGRTAYPVALSFLITGPLGIVFYNIFPAMGPIHVFKMFPYDPLTISQAAMLFLEPVKIAGTRNAIPSLHMAWVLLAWWNSKSLPTWARALAMAFLVFTALATLGTGEHYFVDLVVAFPFALFVQALSRCDLPFAARTRAVPLLTGLLMTLAWLEWLTYGVKLAWISPVIPWLAIALTVFPCYWLSGSVQPSKAVPTCDSRTAEDQELSAVVI